MTKQEEIIWMWRKVYESDGFVTFTLEPVKITYLWSR